MIKLDNIKTKVVLRRVDGIDEIRHVVKCNLNVPFIWSDDKVGKYWKTSRGGYIYFKEITSFEQT